MNDYTRKAYFRYLAKVAELEALKMKVMVLQEEIMAAAREWDSWVKDEANDSDVLWQIEEESRKVKQNG